LEDKKKHFWIIILFFKNN